jgi:hypothetical protein
VLSAPKKERKEKKNFDKLNFMNGLAEWFKWSPARQA